MIIFLNGCQSDGVRSWQRIGTYLPDQLASSEINSVLSPAKIAWTNEGSRAYALEVPPADAVRAVMLLKGSSIASRIKFEGAN